MRFIAPFGLASEVTQDETEESEHDVSIRKRSRPSQAPAILFFALRVSIARAQYDTMSCRYGRSSRISYFRRGDGRIVAS
jgi:hypothetical protein